jgi:hypothetical protein
VLASAVIPGWYWSSESQLIKISEFSPCTGSSVRFKFKQASPENKKQEQHSLHTYGFDGGFNCYDFSAHSDGSGSSLESPALHSLRHVTTAMIVIEIGLFLLCNVWQALDSESLGSWSLLEPVLLEAHGQTGLGLRTLPFSHPLILL